MRSLLSRVVIMAALVTATAACDSFFDVQNSTVVDASELDPKADAATFSLSARQNFAQLYPTFIMYAAWFTGETLWAETFEGGNFARRDVPANDFFLLRHWYSISVARGSADQVVSLLAGAADAASNIDLARAALFSGFNFVIMAEFFCQGAVNGGPPLNPAMMSDSAVSRFTLANTVASTAALSGGSAAAEAAQIAGAALVGRARAHLQAGRKTEAAADADKVPPGFVFNMTYLDDPFNRFRVDNSLWYYASLLRTMAVSPAFRQLSDPRVPVKPPAPDAPAYDQITEYWMQSKYSGYAAPIRLASRVEADYIGAEARGTSTMLQLVQARRAANAQPAYGGPADAASILAEFMEQRAREFYLEGKSIGDLRRNPAALRWANQPGSSLHKPGYGPIRDQLCWPLPLKETQNNPHFR